MVETDDRARDERAAWAEQLPPEFDGFIDAIEDGRVFGWAIDPNQPGHRVRVEIYHGSDLLGVATASRFREDLVSYGDGTGHCAFVFNLPKELWAVDPGNFYACFEGTGVPLMRGPRCSRLLPQDAAIDEISGRAPSAPSDGAQDLGPLIARVEACERAMVTLVHLAHPRSEFGREKSAQIEKLNAYIDRLAESLKQTEEFVLRNDEKLKGAETFLNEFQEQQRRPWYLKGESWSLPLALAAVGVAAVTQLLLWSGSAP